MSRRDTRRAVVVGSGPNGLTAAAFLARDGWEVDVYERLHVPGGAAASSRDILTGAIVDRGAAAHPFGVVSPAFRQLGLADHGLEWLYHDYPLAHPLDEGPAAILHPDLRDTADQLAGDADYWTKFHQQVAGSIGQHMANVLGPTLRIPPYPLSMAHLALRGFSAAGPLAKSFLNEERGKALFLGSAAHSGTTPDTPLTAAFGLLFGAIGMSRGWPVARGGTGSIVEALVRVLESYGGRLHLGHDVTDLRQFESADAVILNMTHAQVLRLEGLDVPRRIRRRLQQWRYGTAAHKVDFLLDGPVPWRDEAVGRAGTVHVVGSHEQIEEAATLVAAGEMPRKPFVLVCQQQVADPSRSDDPGRHVVWAYAQVPQGYVEPRPGLVTDRIEAQIERFAPGFRDRIVERVSHSPRELEEWNANLVGGDIAGGTMVGYSSVLERGLGLRRPYTLAPGLYLASGATPPGGGVHGMAGYWAARAVRKDFSSASSG